MKEKIGKDEKSSELSGFYSKSLEERLELVKEFSGLSEEELGQLKEFGALDFDSANRMAENVIGTMQLPLGIATNFRINGKDYLIPMAIEEPSVIAAASNAAKIARKAFGFKAEATEPIMIGQIQLIAKDLKKARKEINARKKELLERANQADIALVKAGGGARDLILRELKGKKEKFLVLHLLVDVRDAMGANTVNTMCEKIAPKIEEITGGKVRLKIISNLAVYRTAKAKAVFTKKALEESFREFKVKGKEIVKSIIQAFELAEIDEFRACTHNKGIMNGVDAVTIATGNDWRAIEAGAHAFACWKNKSYKPLTKFYEDGKGDLVGEIELPLALGLIGGTTKSNPIARIAVKILGVKNTREFAGVIASVGLANNFAALRALATEGIQRGHMKLHAKNIAVMAGAIGVQIESIAEQMTKEKNISAERAKQILKEMNI